jgi:two-component system, OmpR family, alkaline phosphatase synthesis response regulator PhoP
VETRVSARVLIAEDDRFLSKAAEMVLKRHGYTVLLAADGDEALEQARRERPDLILLDLIMPKRQGFEVLRALKEDAATAAIPVIVMSSLGQDTDVAMALAAGAVAYLEKGAIAPAQIIAAVEAALKAPAA